jgi:ankyrin repeat protein
MVCLPSVFVASAANAQNSTFTADMFPADFVDAAAPTNGCGSQGADGIDVPDDWFGTSFTPACDWHDQCYGTKGATQSYCDLGMLDKSKRACDGGSACEQIAKVYFLGVATFGGEPFRQGQIEACDRTPHLPGRAHGNPHLATFDGLDYGLHTAGEFTLVRDSDGNDDVQARFHPLNDAFTVITGVAVRLGEHDAVVQLDPDTFELVVYLDGEPITASIAAVPEGFIELGEQLPGINQIVTIRRDDGLRVEGAVFGSRIDVSINVFETHFGNISGLLGNADGNPTNELVNADNGETLDTFDLTSTAAIENLYDSGFGESWRIDPEDSMFLPGGPFDYHGDDARSWPRDIVTIADLVGPEVEAARLKCSAAGLEGGELAACFSDIMASGDDSYADTAARSSQRARAVASPESAVVASTTAGPVSDDAELVPSSPLVLAIITRDIDEVERLIDGGEPLNVVSEGEQLSPLSAAALVGDVDIVRLLLAAGAEPHLAALDNSMQPLTLAAATGSVELIELLLDAGADPDGFALGFNDFSPLGAAASSGSAEVVTLLLDAGANPNGPAGTVPPMLGAAVNGSVEVAELLLDAGVDVDVDTDPGPDRSTPLGNAVLLQRVDMVRFLIGRGADRNATINGTPLTFFATDPEILELLGG